MPPKAKGRSRKKQTRLTFSPAPSSAVPAGSPVSEKRSPAFVRFARPGQINSFYSTDSTARKRKRADNNTVSERPPSSGSNKTDEVLDKTELPSSDPDGSPLRKKGKRAALSVSHSKSIADDASSSSEGNASPAPQSAHVSQEMIQKLQTHLLPKPSSKRETSAEIHSAELKQKEQQQKLEKAKKAAAKTKSSVKKAKSQQRSDKVAKQQAKLERREERLEKLRLKLEEQQRKLEEEREKLKQASQAEPDSEPESSDIDLPSAPRTRADIFTTSGRFEGDGPLSSVYRYLRSDTDSDDVEPATSNNKTKAKKDEDALDHSEGSEDDIIASSLPQRRRRADREQSNELLEEPHDEDDVKPHTPRLKRGLMRPQKGSHDEELSADRGDEEKDQNQLDLEDDLDFLEDSAVKDTRTRGTVANSAKAKRMAYLDQLRKRRAGGKRDKEESSTSTEEEETEDGAEGDSKKAGSEEQHDTSSDDDGDSQPDQSIEDLDQDDPDFVVASDPDDTLGAPDDEAVLPFEFSRHSFKRLPEYFRDVVEWMVHNQLNPAFPRDDPIYQAAFNKINDEAMGKTKSQYISSVWSSYFIRALEARPVLEWGPYTGQDSCEACGRSTHSGVAEIVLKGKPYSLRTLRPLTDGEDEEADGDTDEEEAEEEGSEGEEDEHGSSESDSQSEDEEGNENGAEGEDNEEDQEYDRQGNPIPPDGTSFIVGTHCHDKALKAHKIIHWRYELNEWVVGWLEENQILTRKQIRRRRKWSVKLQTEFANEVVDFMTESNQVQRLWWDFKGSNRRVRNHMPEDRRFVQSDEMDLDL